MTTAQASIRWAPGACWLKALQAQARHRHARVIYMQDWGTKLGSELQWTYSAPKGMVLPHCGPPAIIADGEQE